MNESKLNLGEINLFDPEELYAIALHLLFLEFLRKGGFMWVESPERMLKKVQSNDTSVLVWTLILMRRRNLFQRALIRRSVLASPFRSGEGSHGGSALYCKESIEFKVGYDVEQLSVCNVIECSAIRLNSCSEKMIVVCVYRPDISPLADNGLFLRDSCPY
ncbi:hypothetical protein WA026_015696 [Henosepilachna vigintioctopunctata]|uniref:SCP domain-containing protein n=1 Tax=Henosepilachna vigintioctopunctata TaxID=420089 RepID=A0AAW1V2T3_9CUCU